PRTPPCHDHFSVGWAVPTIPMLLKNGAPSSRQFFHSASAISFDVLLDTAAISTSYSVLSTLYCFTRLPSEPLSSADCLASVNTARGLTISDQRVGDKPPQID